MRESEYLTADSKLLKKYRSLPFLRSIEKKYLKDIVSRSKMRIYDPDEIITKQGTYDNWVYILLSGSVSVVKDDDEIAVLNKPGDTFGEMAMIDGKERSASILAETETVCFSIDTSFLKNVDRERHFAFYAVFYQLFAEIMASRLRETDKELVKVKKELERMKEEYQ